LTLIEYWFIFDCQPSHQDCNRMTTHFVDGFLRYDISGMADRKYRLWTYGENRNHYKYSM